MRKTFMHVQHRSPWIAIWLAVVMLCGCKEPPASSATEPSQPASSATEPSQPAEEKHRSFESPEVAVEALVGAAEAADVGSLEEIFGPGGESLVQWGDPVAQRQDRERFLEMYREKHALVDGEDGQKLLVVGADDWPLPAPLVEQDGRWSFDGDAGADELVYRRVGRNELGAIAVLRGYVDAQYEYASKRRDGNRAGLFAAHLISDPGRQNGLYWPTQGNEPRSPAGPFVAAAAGEGYRRAARGEPTPYHGYFYRILYAQGDDAAGGAKEYFLDGRMVGGFALLAWPSAYAVSGVKTFMVNQDGVVYEKDLGPDTATAVDEIKQFDPDDTWNEVPAEPSDD